MAAEDYLADIDRAEAWLKPRAGHRPWFRFPFLNEGRQDKVKRDAIRAGLAARGLRNGYVTAESSDWHMETLTIAAKAAGKTMDMDALRDLLCGKPCRAQRSSTKRWRSRRPGVRSSR